MCHSFFMDANSGSAARKRLFACGSMVLAILSVFRFCALRAQKRNTKEDEVPLEGKLPAAAWYFTSSVYGFSAQSTEKPYTDKRKYRGSRAGVPAGPGA